MTTKYLVKHYNATYRYAYSDMRDAEYIRDNVKFDDINWILGEPIIGGSTKGTVCESKRTYGETFFVHNKIERYSPPANWIDEVEDTEP